MGRSHSVIKSDPTLAAMCELVTYVDRFSANFISLPRPSHAGWFAFPETSGSQLG